MYICKNRLSTESNILNMKDIVKASDNNRVLIIGNGFDLDLGWNTRFSDFIKSKHWPQNMHQGSLLSYLQRRYLIHNWFDIEAEIGVFASDPSRRGQTSQTIKLNEDYFNKLVEGFKRYLIEETQKDINTNSIAAKVFHNILQNMNFSSIYSFNYTDLHDIASRLNIHTKFSYEHVHGSIKEDNIIIGAPEDKELNKGYEFLYKTFNSNYQSNNLIYDLREAREVVFFGHSLGPTDYHYFRSFFKRQCIEDMQRTDAKKITIFTYDNISRMSIMSQLRAMNDQKTNLLVNLNDFKVIMTKTGGEPDLTNFLKHLEATSTGTHSKQISRRFSIK